jgi:(1->4)-alpha-D-glucan 1-alpha-D-glucosylmutase
MAQQVQPPSPPRATYRVQLHGGFGFKEAASIVPYLAELGITHLYCSPYLQARAGSTHGYDIVDPARLNEELGGEEGHARLLDALRAHGMGHILDIVPNHMAINDSANAWWWDVLKNGHRSRFASFFDIDWGPPERAARRVLVPILSERYERVLEAGELTFGHADEESVARYHAYTLPLAPGTEPGDIEAVNRDDEAVHEVLEEQNYRLEHWRVAGPELNYRRFFAVNDLAALRADNPEVFGMTHALILGPVERGDLQGLRVDHIDGLRRPAAYLAELRAAAPNAYIVVEKILAIDERLPVWPVEGTTGYDFLNRVNGLFVDPAGANGLTRVYEMFTGDVAALDNQRRAKKLAFIHSELESDLERLTDLLARICERDPRHRNYARAELRAVLAETMAAFPVYRTYADAASPPMDERDRRVVERAIQGARDANHDLEGELLDLLSDVLLLRIDSPGEDDLALRFQQTTGAAMAKAIEDTLFYTYNRLVSLNEVGSDPGRFGVTPEEFHRLNAAAQRDWPSSMLATSTHDTKRSEDVRLRLSLLSQLPELWGEAVARWSEMNDSHRRRNRPSRDDEYLLYQTLVGAWPLDGDRATEYMTKAAKEAKVHTSWIDPDHDYDAALRSFVRAVMSDEAFLSEVRDFVGPLVRPGRIASLAQTLMKLTAPGVPDIYQGSEVWDLSLVDPDNRRAVDYCVRRTLLDSLGDSPPGVHHDGAAKMFVIQRALAVRGEHPEAFGAHSTYEPLAATGDHAARVIAYVRGHRVIVVAPRLTYELPDMAGTILPLPPGTWTDRFSGRIHYGVVGLGELWSDFPVCLLTRPSAEGRSIVGPE